MFDSMPAVISTYGQEIDHLIRFIYIVTASFFVVMEGLLIWMVVKSAFFKPAPSRYETGETLFQMRWVLALALSVLALDLVIDAKGAAIWTRVKEEFPECDLTVRATAKQFDWTFTYTGADGKLDTADDITASRTLRVPVHQKVRVLLTSRDVIHSFFLHEVRLKQDILPGREIPVWFELTATGTYNIFCSELCGFGHTRMSGVLESMDDKEFQAWMAQEIRSQKGGK